MPAKKSGASRAAWPARREPRATTLAKSHAEPERPLVSDGSPSDARVDAKIAAPVVLAYVARDRVRTLLRAAFPRRRARLILARTGGEFVAALNAELVDAALVDVGGDASEVGAISALGPEYPSIPFFAISGMRPSDAPGLARCAGFEFTDIVVDGIDDVALRELVVPQGFSSRFAAALRTPPPALRLLSDLQQRTWRCIVGHAGRPVRTDVLANLLGVTREHLSRTFPADGAPNLKQVIDLVRLISAAELAKNPAHDVRDVATVLGFASSSHLSSTAQRVLGTKAGSLARLRTVDLVDRFIGRREAVPVLQ